MSAYEGQAVVRWTSPDDRDATTGASDVKPKLSPYQRAEAIKRRAAGETLASIARTYAVDLSMISRL
jgi:hypothetical protein